MIFNVNALLEENGNIESVLGQVFVSQGLFFCSSNDLEAFLLNEKEASMIPMKRCGFLNDALWNGWVFVKKLGHWIMKHPDQFYEWVKQVVQIATEPQKESKVKKKKKKENAAIIYDDLFEYLVDNPKIYYSH